MAQSHVTAATVGVARANPWWYSSHTTRPRPVVIKIGRTTYGTSVSRHTLFRNHPASDASVIDQPLAYRSLSSTGWPFIAATNVSCATGVSVSQAAFDVATLRLTSAESRPSRC